MVLMLWTRTFIPTLRANPAGEPLSRQLLQRAGYLRGEGHWLPLAARSLGKIMAIARDEINQTGGQEMHLPDAAAFESVARELRSYKQLPQLWYHPGSPLEACCFHLESAPAPCAPDAVCRRILERCGVAYSATEWSLVVYAEEGEDAVAVCPSCGNAAPLDVAETVAPAAPMEDPPGDLAPEPFHTPGRKTIAQVAEFVGLPESAQMKSLVLVANGAPVLVMLRGDRQLSEAKFARLTGDAQFRPARSDEIFEWFGAAAGSLGPVGVKNMPILMDRALSGRRNMIAGANRDDYHLRNVTPGEDFHAAEHSLSQAAAGDGCIRCHAAIEVLTAIELARFGPAAAIAGLHATDAQSREAPLLARAFRMPLERILFAIALSSHDADGLILPSSIAPFDAIVTPANYGDSTQREAAHSIYQQCVDSGLDALLDDRDERPGVKFKDADLTGVPYRITVGKKLAEGLVEVVERRTKKLTQSAAAQAAAAVRDAITTGL
jgi:prolyl-tRNA synthetase